MANKLQLKAAGEHEAANSDPFAELTRIMGFDPRVQPTPRVEDDLASDLERELMGDLVPDLRSDARAARLSGFADVASDQGEGGLDEDHELGEAFASAFGAEMTETDDEVAEPSDGGSFDIAPVDMDFTAPLAPPAARENAVPHGGLTPSLEESLRALLSRNERPAARPAAGWTAANASIPLSPAADVADTGPQGSRHSTIFGDPFQAGTAVAAPASDGQRDGAPGNGEPQAPGDMMAGDDAGQPEEEADPFAVLAALGTGAEEPAGRQPPVETRETPRRPAPTQAVLRPAYGFMRTGMEDAPVRMPARSEMPAPQAPQAMPPAAYPVSGRAASEQQASRPQHEPPVKPVGSAGWNGAAPVAPSTGDTRMRPAPEPIPDIETIDVPEPAMALADDLDIPVPEFHAEVPPAPPLDDLEHEFASAFNDLMAIEEVAKPAPATAEQDEADLVAKIDRLFSEAELTLGGSELGQAHAAPTPSADVAEAMPAGTVAFDEAEFLAGSYSQQAYQVADDGRAAGEADYDEGSAVLMPGYGFARRRRRRRGVLVTALAAGVAVAAIGAFVYLHGGGKAGETPVLLKADAGPVKVKPKNPGGAKVPNQDSQVYDRVAGEPAPAATQQKKLVSAEEQPVDVSARLASSDDLPGVNGDAADDAFAPASTADAASQQALPPVTAGPAAVSTAAAAPEAISSPRKAEAAQPRKAEQDPAARNDATGAAAPTAAKAEDRIPPSHDAKASADRDMIAVAPRKVRTMVVRPDGTMVPSETPASEVADAASVKAAALEAPVSEKVAKKAASLEGSVGAVASDDGAAASAQAGEPAEKAADAPAGKKPAQHEIRTPEKVAIAPSRPADQPVEIIGQAKDETVASLERAPAAPKAASTASGGWAMQIASQPTEQGAQASYQALARRYGNVLSGHAVDIVKAEVSGKGTYYRVRVPAGSRDEAIALCTKYKSAGGSCFVSR